MRIVDITHGYYHGMPSYPSAWYPRFAIHEVMTPATDPADTGRTFTRLELFAHNATHIESARHFYRDRETLDRVPLEVFIGRACVADLSHKQPCEPVTDEDLQKAVGDVWQPGDRLLVRTDYLRDHWGRQDYWDRPPYLTPSAADWAVEHNAALVGIDCLTERPGDSTSPVHRRLLDAGIPILEYITDLHNVQQRVVYLVALPTKVSGVEAAPARAVVFEGWQGAA